MSSVKQADYSNMTQPDDGTEVHGHRDVQWTSADGQRHATRAARAKLRHAAWEVRALHAPSKRPPSPPPPSSAEGSDV